MNTYVAAVRFLGYVAILAILGLAVVVHHFDGRPDWCPPDVASAQCAQNNSTAEGVTGPRKAHEKAVLMP